MDTIIACKNSPLILSDNLPIAFHTFIRRMLISLSVDKILLPRYQNWSTNFRGLPLRVKLCLYCLKHIHSVLFAFMLRPMPLAAYSRLCPGILPGLVYLQEFLPYIVCFLPFIIWKHFLLLDQWMFKMRSLSRI